MIVAFLFVASLAMWQPSRHRSYYDRIDGWGVYGIGSGGFLLRSAWRVRQPLSHRIFIERVWVADVAIRIRTGPSKGPIRKSPPRDLDRDDFFLCGPGRSRVAGIQAERRAAGACVGCGYPLQGISSNRCPECGTSIIENGGATHVAP